MKQTFTSLAHLKAQYGKEHIPYQALLGTVEWRNKREEIIKRDADKCTKCNQEATFPFFDGKKWTHVSAGITSEKKSAYMFDENGIGKEVEYDEESPWCSFAESPTVLHVHHRYYVRLRRPWEYKNEALLTLCNFCHLELHKTEIIPVYELDNEKLIKMPVQACIRCHGAGYFPEYRHRDAGVCYKCNGDRYINLTL